MKKVAQILFLAGVLAMVSCQTDQQPSSNQLVVRLAAEPDRLNPILSRSAVSSAIENLIFLPMAEIDPVTLEFTPVLLEEIPRPVQVDYDSNQVASRIDLKIKKDARWPDQSPVTAKDILFTYKTIFHPDIDAGRLRASLSFIQRAELDDDDPLSISFYLDTTAFLADQVVTNYYVLPEYVYDSLGIMRQVTLEQLIHEEVSADERAQIKPFADRFSSEKFGREKVLGSGAYELIQWVTGYEIKLRRKKDWWGHRYAGSNHFKAIPDEIIYRVIPDEQLAITALGQGQVDVVSQVNAQKFKAMQNTGQQQYQFLTPRIPQYYYLFLNNDSPLLADKTVRQALDHLIDQQTMIETAMGGYGEVLTAPLLPESRYYDDKILPRTPDVEQAKKLLAEAGWMDTDDDGIIDKVIDGTSQDLRLRFTITGSELGRQIALLFRDQAKKVGIDVEIMTQKFSPNTIMDLQSGDFEIVAASARQSFLETNLRANWHSESIGENGSNYAAYRSPVTDSIIEALEVEKDADKRVHLYHRFHRQIFEDVPVVFLMMPLERLLVSSDWQVITSARRPGYFEALFEKKTQ